MVLMLRYVSHFVAFLFFSLCVCRCESGSLYDLQLNEDMCHSLSGQV
uniref:Uncharacterized protein n=1 Tax=Rhizophora mucronata TaxID=61149 RepID=A0A2P2N756_RHIMU